MLGTMRVERRAVKLCARAARTVGVNPHGADWRGANVRGLTG